jgi:hypothetical protein
VATTAGDGVGIGSFGEKCSLVAPGAGALAGDFLGYQGPADAFEVRREFHDVIMASL